MSHPRIGTRTQSPEILKGSSQHAPENAAGAATATAKDNLLESLAKDQFKETVHFSRFPPRLEQEAGLYSSDVHIFTSDKAALFRDLVHFPDDNGFVTMFVAQFLLEAAEQDPTLPVSREQLDHALQAIKTHKDKNREGDGIYRFWNQKQVDDGRYISYPANFAIPLEKLLPAAERLRKFGEKHGHPKSPLAKKTLGFPKRMLPIFRIPPDFDDTFVNLAMRARMASNDQRFPGLTSLDEVRATAAEASRALVEYAYRPFSAERDENLIDSRTYFWLRDFIHAEKDQAAREGRPPSLALATTWVQNETERLADAKTGTGDRMPFGVNNVDASVCSNVLFGLTSALMLEEPGTIPEWFNADVQAVYRDTAKMLGWLVEKDVLADPRARRCVLLYYPPVYDLYSFAARALHLMENPACVGKAGQRNPVVDEARQSLEHALRGAATEQLLARAQHAGDAVYWDDDLTENDKDLLGRPAHRDDTRLFSTAGALNALIDIWTRTVPAADASGAEPRTLAREWLPNTPPEVIAAAKGSATFLTHQANGSTDAGYENVFFSSSAYAGIPKEFPYNTGGRSKMEGAESNPDITGKGDSKRFRAVSGVMDEAEYEKYLRMFEEEPAAPAADPSRKTFFYWSSPAVTKGMMLLGLTKMSALGWPDAP